MSPLVKALSKNAKWNFFHSLILTKIFIGWQCLVKPPKFRLLVELAVRQSKEPRGPPCGARETGESGSLPSPSNIARLPFEQKVLQTCYTNTDSD